MAGKDRIKPYLENLVKGYVFDELSDGFVERIGAGGILSGVPVPIEAVQFAGFATGKGEIKGLDIAKACGLVLGAAPDFPYSGAYKEFLVKVLGGAAKTLEVLDAQGSELFAEGIDAGAKNADAEAALAGGKLDPEMYFMQAACYFRAALQIDPAAQNPLYGYGLCCREIYEHSEDEKKTGDFKAEFIETMEALTVHHPKFPFAYYYLGFAYLNMGLYIKAQLAWNSFLDFIEDDPAKAEAFDEINEIRERITTLKDPVRIEEGVLAIESGKFIQGLEILSEYENGDYQNWWPLHYYIGVAYASMGDAEAGIDAFKRALTLSPSNVDIMEELRLIYELTGDGVNAKKYADKITRVLNNMELEKLEN